MICARFVQHLSDNGYESRDCRPAIRRALARAECHKYGEVHRPDSERVEKQFPSVQDSGHDTASGRR